VTVTPFPGHKWQHCTRRTCNGCFLCHGGLALCATCGGLEGALPTDCPGEYMGEFICGEVYAGRIDYRRGEGWVKLKPHEKKPWHVKETTP
jgi:hypothetical protein